MSHTSKSLVAAYPALILFGNDPNGKPRAGWFAASEADIAERSSADMQLVTLRVSTEEEKAFAARLPRGRIQENDRPYLPLLSRQRANLLRALIEPAAVVPEEEGNQPASPTNLEPIALATGSRKRATIPVLIDVSPEPAPVIPNSWDEVKPGSLVLAYDKDAEAWFEAIVVNAIGDVYRLKWRHYSEYPKITRYRHQLGLMCPAKLGAVA